MVWCLHALNATGLVDTRNTYQDMDGRFCDETKLGVVRPLKTSHGWVSDDCRYVERGVHWSLGHGKETSYIWPVYKPKLEPVCDCLKVTRDGRAEEVKTI